MFGSDGEAIGRAADINLRAKNSLNVLYSSAFNCHRKQTALGSIKIGLGHRDTILVLVGRARKAHNSILSGTKVDVESC